jgi:uncharacterized protein YndB with AHSA1/START domain
VSLFRTSRELPAAPEAVFAAFRDPARLARWWGPDGFTNTIHTFEFRAGGSWEFTMHGPDGHDYPNLSEFLEIVPDSMVRIRHISQPRFELSVSLEATPAGTLVPPTSRIWIGSRGRSARVCKEATDPALRRISGPVTREKA